MIGSEGDLNREAAHVSAWRTPKGYPGLAVILPANNIVMVDGAAVDLEVAARSLGATRTGSLWLFNGGVGRQVGLHILTRAPLCSCARALVCKRLEVAEAEGVGTVDRHRMGELRAAMAEDLRNRRARWQKAAANAAAAGSTNARTAGTYANESWRVKSPEEVLADLQEMFRKYGYARQQAASCANCGRPLGAFGTCVVCLMYGQPRAKEKPPHVFSRRTTDEDRRRAFALLGLQPGAGDAAVKEARKRLALANHPDRGGDAERMKAINVAADILLAGRQ